MKLIITVITAAFLLIACGNSGSSSQAMKEESTDLSISGITLDEKGFIGESVTDTATQSAPPDQKQPGSEPLVPPQKKYDWDKKIVKNADLNLEVKDYQSYYNSMREKVRGLGGYLAQEEQSQTDF